MQRCVGDIGWMGYYAMLGYPTGMDKMRIVSCTKEERQMFHSLSLDSHSIFTSVFPPLLLVLLCSLKQNQGSFQF